MNGKKKDYYSNDNKFDSDFDMKNRKTSTTDTRYGKSPVRKGQLDYEVQFYNNDLYKGEGDYAKPVEPPNDYLEINEDPKKSPNRDYVNLSQQPKDYMDMEGYISSQNAANKARNNDKLKGKPPSKVSSPLYDKGYLSPAALSGQKEKTKALYKPQQGFINKVYESDDYEKMGPAKATEKVYTRSPSMDMASNGGQEAMKRAQQIFGEFKKPARKY